MNNFIQARLIFVTTAMLIASAAAAQDQELRSEYMDVDDARPVAKALEEIGKRYGLVVTYEDPPYAYVDDVSDVNAEVRKDLGRGASTAVPRVVVPQGGPLSFSYEVRLDSGKPSSPSTLVQRLIDGQGASVNGGKFRLLDVYGSLHVVPAGIRDRSGEWKVITSVLDVSVTIPESPRDVTQMVIAICDSVSRTGSAKLEYGSGPYLFPAEAPKVKFGVSRENARMALMHALSLSGRQVAWQIFYAPDLERYFLHLRIVPEDPRALPLQIPANKEGPMPRGDR